MNRPKYESIKDLENEKYIANIFEKLWNCKFIKLNPTKWIVDFLIQKENNYSWCEVKRFNHNFGKYVFMISYKKIEAAKILSETSGCKFIIIFNCNDCVCYHVWDFKKEYKFEYGGRTMTTRDSMDIEPVFRINPSDFIRIDKHD